MRSKHFFLSVFWLTFVWSAIGWSHPARAADELPAPTELSGRDRPWDGGERLLLSWKLPDPKTVPAGLQYEILVGSAERGIFEKLQTCEPAEADWRHGKVTVEIGDRKQDKPYWFHVRAMAPDGRRSPMVAVGPVKATRQWISGNRLWPGLIMALLCGAVLYWIQHARSGKPLKIRKIAGLEAVEEAVGRATETGRSCMFIPGIQDITDIQTIASLTVMSRVAETVAEFGATLEVPTCRSLVMTAARETVQAAYLSAGRPDAYNENLIYYVTDEQFGYVANVTGTMVREKPAACFLMGSFFAEALILAETGNSIGAIQVAGTAQPAQLPFFVAACDFTLIGEEFFAASAYLSGSPEQLGSLKGQDTGKVMAAVLLLVGFALATVAELTGSETFSVALDFLKNTLLTSGN